MREIQKQYLHPQSLPVSLFQLTWEHFLLSRQAVNFIHISTGSVISQEPPECVCEGEQPILNVTCAILWAGLLVRIKIEEEQKARWMTIFSSLCFLVLRTTWPPCSHKHTLVGLPYCALPHSGDGLCPPHCSDGLYPPPLWGWTVSSPAVGMDYILPHSGRLYLLKLWAKGSPSSFNLLLVFGHNHEK